MKVNALVLTIPFGMVMDLGPSYWQELDEMFKKSSCNDVIGYKYAQIQFRNSILTISYGCTIALILILVYYMLRPRSNNELFVKWWSIHGNKLFFSLILLTTAGITALMTLNAAVMNYSFIHPEAICEFANDSSTTIGYSLLLWVGLIFVILLL